MEKSWSNTLLVAYSLIPKIIKKIDFGVKTRVNSGYKSKHLKNGVSTERLISEIISLNDEKRKLFNAIYLVNTAMQNVSDKSRTILALRLVKKVPFKNIVELTGMPIRTVFRRLEKGESEFSAALAKVGFDEKRLCEEYATSIYLAQIHKRLCEDKYFLVINE